MRRQRSSIVVALVLVAAGLSASNWLVPLTNRKVEELYRSIAANEPMNRDLSVYQAFVLWSARAFTILAVASVGLGLVAKPTSRRLSSVAVDLALFAATLVASGWLITLNDCHIEYFYECKNDPDPVVGALAVEKEFMVWSDRVLVVLAVASVGLGAIAIRRPGPAPRRARWRPGRVAAAVGLTVSSALLASEFANYYFDLMLDGWRSDLLCYFWGINAEVGGTAILMAWLMTAVSGRWHAARGWRDDLGLALGIFWLVGLVWMFGSPLIFVALQSAGPG